MASGWALVRRIMPVFSEARAATKALLCSYDRVVSKMLFHQVLTPSTRFTMGVSICCWMVDSFSWHLCSTVKMKLINCTLLALNLIQIVALRKRLFVLPDSTYEQSMGYGTFEEDWHPVSDFNHSL